jgi:hypothetical protein
MFGLKLYPKKQVREKTVSEKKILSTTKKNLVDEAVRDNSNEPSQTTHGSH